MDAVWKNISYSARMLLKKPSVTIVAIIAIGLGIGANTAIFSVVNTVLLQPLPYPQPEQLVMLATEQRNQALDGRGTFSVPDFFDVQKSSTTLQYVATAQLCGRVHDEGNSRRTYEPDVGRDRAPQAGRHTRTGKGGSRSSIETNRTTVAGVKHERDLQCNVVAREHDARLSPGTPRAAWCVDPIVALRAE